MEQIKEINQRIQSNRFFYNGAKVLLVIIIAVICIFVGKLVINFIFYKKKEKYTEEERRRIRTLNKISKLVLKTSVFAVVIIDILSVFIDVKAVLTVAGVGTIAIGIGAQAIVEDILSGFVILAENLFLEGEYIELQGGHYGKVEKIGLRMTSIRQLDGSLYMVHNGQIKELTNYSKGSVRACVKVAVAFEEKLDRVAQILNRLFDVLILDSKNIYLNRPQIMGVEELADSSVMIRIEVDVKAEYKRMAERELRKQIKERFDEEQIEIPYNKVVSFVKINESENGKN